MADDSPPERSAADKERSRQQSRPVNGQEAGLAAGKHRTGRPARRRHPSGPSKTAGQGRWPQGPAPPPSGRAAGPPARAQDGRRWVRGGGTARSGRSAHPAGHGRGPGGRSRAILSPGEWWPGAVIVAVLVVIKVTGSSTARQHHADGLRPPRCRRSSSTRSTTIPASVYDKVGVNSTPDPDQPAHHLEEPAHRWFWRASRGSSPSGRVLPVLRRRTLGRRDLAVPLRQVHRHR